MSMVGAVILGGALSGANRGTSPLSDEQSRQWTAKYFKSKDVTPIIEHFISSFKIEHDREEKKIVPNSLVQNNSVSPLTDEAHQKISDVLKKIEATDLDRLIPAELSEIKRFLDPGKNEEMSSYLAAGTDKDKEKFAEVEKLSKDLEKLTDVSRAAVMFKFTTVISSAIAIITIMEKISPTVINGITQPGPGLFSLTAATSVLCAAAYFVADTFTMMRKANKMEKQLENNFEQGPQKKTLDKYLRLSNLYAKVLTAESTYGERQAREMRAKEIANSVSDPRAALEKLLATTLGDSAFNAEARKEHGNTGEPNRLGRVLSAQTPSPVSVT